MRGRINLNNFEVVNLPTFLDLHIHLEKLISDDLVNWGKTNQICINTIASEKLNYTYGAGSLDYDWDNQKIVEQNGIKSVVVPKKEPKINEKFDTLCGQFEGSIFQVIYLLLTAKYNLGRLRLMNMPPKTCLSWHKDTSRRLHYPIITQDGCMMIIDDEVLHLEKNKWYMTDTTKNHTAVNASLKSRLHLVAEIF